LRCYTDNQYERVGCILTNDITSADLIIGVKEVPLDNLYPEKSYMYFSHTIKGQPANMPALKDILEKRIRLFDYECIKEAKTDNPQRLVAFGRFAGLAGGFDFLQGIGEFLLHKQISTPFLHTGYSYMYPSVDDAKDSLRKIGEMIKKKHLPRELCPFIVGFTSNGRVSKGAQEVLECLPHEYVDPNDLERLFKSEPRRDIIYLTIIESKHMYVHKESGQFNRDDFYSNPQNYISTFADKFVPYISILYHCMFWDVKHPKILTFEEGQRLTQENKFRLLGISDITCDMNGSIDYLQKFTTIEKPFFTIDTKTNILEDDLNKITDTSILYHAVDHLPAEFPIDASKHFSERLTPFIENILKSEYPCDYNGQSDLPLEILNSCETWNGKLMPKYQYLFKELGKHFEEYKES
jgi:alpha-aminoadipic semialdehyde synthase